MLVNKEVMRVQGDRARRKNKPNMGETPMPRTLPCGTKPILRAAGRRISGAGKRSYGKWDRHRAVEKQSQFGCRTGQDWPWEWGTRQLYKQTQFPAGGTVPRRKSVGLGGVMR